MEGACERSQTYNENPGKDDAIVRFKANIVTIVLWLYRLPGKFCVLNIEI